MKKKQTIVLICVLLVGFLISGATVLAGKWDNAGPGAGHHRQRGNDGLMLLPRYLYENQIVAVLAETSGRPAEIVRQKLKDQKLRAVLDEYAIDRETFRAALQARTAKLIQDLAAGGFITAEQANEFNQKMAFRAQRRELMSRLVEKGIQDGTITPEQAQMLKHKRF